MILNLLEVHHLASNSVDQPAQLSIETMRDISNTHLRSSNRQHIPDVSFHFTLLHNIAGKQSTLTQPSNVEFSLKHLVCIDRITCHFRLCFKVYCDTGLRAVSHFDASCVRTSAISNLCCEVFHARVEAAITEAMEDGVWDGRRRVSRESSGSGNHNSGFERLNHFLLLNIIIKQQVIANYLVSDDLSNPHQLALQTSSQTFFKLAVIGILVQLFKLLFVGICEQLL